MNPKWGVSCRLMWNGGVVRDARLQARNRPRRGRLDSARQVSPYRAKRRVSPSSHAPPARALDARARISKLGLRVGVVQRERARAYTRSAESSETVRSGNDGEGSNPCSVIKHSNTCVAYGARATLEYDGHAHAARGVMRHG